MAEEKFCNACGKDLSFVELFISGDPEDLGHGLCEKCRKPVMDQYEQECNDLATEQIAHLDSVKESSESNFPTYENLSQRLAESMNSNSECSHENTAAYFTGENEVLIRREICNDCHAFRDEVVADQNDVNEHYGVNQMSDSFSKSDDQIKAMSKEELVEMVLSVRSFLTKEYFQNCSEDEPRYRRAMILGRIEAAVYMPESECA